MSDLRSSGEHAAVNDLTLRSFRAVKDGPTFCWDLFLVELADDEGDEIALPVWLEHLGRAIRSEAGAVEVRHNLEDRVFVTAHVVLERGAIELFLNDAPGWLRWVKLRASEGRSELLWCVRVEGGPELGTPIAGAWQNRCEVTTRAAQQDLPLGRKAASTAAPRADRVPLSVVPPELPPEIDDDGNPVDVLDDEPPVLIPRKRRTKRDELS